MLSRPVLFAVLALGLLATSFAEEAAAEAEEEPAFAQVVFYKGLILDGNYMVVSRNFSVKYSLYNVGTK